MNSFRFKFRNSQVLGFATKNVLAILLSCSPLIAFSQEAPLGTLSGTFQDADYGGSFVGLMRILKNTELISSYRLGLETEMDRI